MVLIPLIIAVACFYGVYRLHWYIVSKQERKFHRRAYSDYLTQYIEHCRVKE